jgi:hypothetical protein
MSRALALLTVLALLVTACGGGSSAGTEKSEDGVRATMRAMLEAFRDKDYDAVCDLMTKEARAEVTEDGDGDCKSMLAFAGAFLPKDEIDKLLDDVDSAEVTIDGNRATSTGVGDEDDSVYVWQDGKWFVGPDGDADDEEAATETEPEETEAAPAEVTVTEDGFQQRDDALLWGGVLTNATAESDAEGVSVNLNALDANGDVIASQEITVGWVPAGEAINVGAEVALEDGGKVKDVEAEVAVDDQSAASGSKLPPVENARFAKEEFGGFTIRAQLTNDADAPMSLLTSAFAVLRDARGDIVGGTSTVPLASDLPAGRRRSIELSGFAEVKGVDDVDVSVAPEYDE